MVDNKATALSVAYDPSNAMSEAAFLHRPVNSAVSANALAYQYVRELVANSKIQMWKQNLMKSLTSNGQGQSRVQIIILQDKLEDARHTNSNVEVDGPMPKEPSKTTNSSCQQRIMQLKSKSDSWCISRSDWKQLFNQRSSPSKSERFVGSCAWKWIV